MNLKSRIFNFLTLSLFLISPPSFGLSLELQEKIIAAKRQTKWAIKEFRQTQSGYYFARSAFPDWKEKVIDARAGFTTSLENFRSLLASIADSEANDLVVSDFRADFNEALEEALTTKATQSASTRMFFGKSLTDEAPLVLDSEQARYKRYLFLDSSGVKVTHDSIFVKFHEFSDGIMAKIQGFCGYQVRHEDTASHFIFNKWRSGVEEKREIFLKSFAEFKDFVSRIPADYSRLPILKAKVNELAGQANKAFSVQQTYNLAGRVQFSESMQLITQSNWKKTNSFPECDRRLTPLESTALSYDYNSVVSD